MHHKSSYNIKNLTSKLKSNEFYLKSNIINSLNVKNAKNSYISINIQKRTLLYNLIYRFSIVRYIIYLYIILLYIIINTLVLITYSITCNTIIPKGIIGSHNGSLFSGIEG